jgi:alpha-ketoglutaric semialdehyde dehydrogenase
MNDIPDILTNWIDGHATSPSDNVFAKVNPATGALLCRATRSGDAEVNAAVNAAHAAFSAWAATTPVRRGEILHSICMTLREQRERMARIVAKETGKNPKSALAETDGAIALGLFFAGEGQRLYGRTTTSGTPNKAAMTIRRPIGVAGLIIAANTPIANVAWKVFPALICGNTVVLKAAEDTPATAWFFAELAHSAGLPAGVLNVIQGIGSGAGRALVAHSGVDVISFTGSTRAGREIAEIAGRRLARVSLELGGKNPLVVCDDAKLDNAAHWIIQSAFSNAGQRCAAGSRVICFESVYKSLREKLLTRAAELKVGPTDADDYGPVVNERQLQNILSAIAGARDRGATILCGGERIGDRGYYIAPTFIENVDPQDEISTCELFGPVACLYPVRGFAEALTLANDSPYGLTACIHTRSVHRAQEFIEKVQAGVVVVNAGTFGSEPHMPFGGMKQSGNGSREPGTEALDVYSTLKDVYITHDPTQL